MRDLPAGAVVGTASLRRQALVKRMRPDLAVVPLRGNVETRLRKIEAGEADATLLAVAGLKRLGLLSAAAALLDIDEFLPAVGQGAIGIETRAGDAATRALVAKIDDADTATALAAERAFLAVLDGSCRTPIGGHARIDGGTIRFRGIIVKPDGSEAFEVLREGGRAQAAELGADAGRELKSRAGADFFTPELTGAASPHAARARRAAHRRGAARAGSRGDHRAVAAHRRHGRCRDRRRTVGGNPDHQRQCGARDRNAYAP